VKIWGELVGAVAWDEATGYASFEYDSKFKENGWELAPAYDVCHAYQPKHKWVSQHALSINGKRTNIAKEDLLAIGKSIKHKKAEETIDEISNTVGQWKSFADQVKVSPKLRDEIADTLICSI
jgi:serine/threonine-protein kinase HipA